MRLSPAWFCRCPKLRAPASPAACRLLSGCKAPDAAGEAPLVGALQARPRVEAGSQRTRRANNKKKVERCCETNQHPNTTKPRTGEAEATTTGQRYRHEPSEIWY